MSTERELLVQEINQVRFTPVRVREGYAMGDVDDLLDRLVSALQTGEPVAELVRSAVFPPVRLREGYDMGEVDRFLEHVVSVASTADRTPTRYVDAPEAPPSGAPVAPSSTPVPNVIQEQRGLLSRLLGRD